MKNVIKMLIVAILGTIVLCAIYKWGFYNAVTSAQLVSIDSQNESYTVAFGNGSNDQDLQYHTYSGTWEDNTNAETTVDATIYSIDNNDVTIKTVDGALWTWTNTNTFSMTVDTDAYVVFVGEYNPEAGIGTMAELHYLNNNGVWVIAQ